MTIWPRSSLQILRRLVYPEKQRNTAPAPCACFHSAEALFCDSHCVLVCRYCYCAMRLLSVPKEGSAIRITSWSVSGSGVADVIQSQFFSATYQTMALVSLRLIYRIMKTEQSTLVNCSAIGLVNVRPHSRKGRSKRPEVTRKLSRACRVWLI